MFILSIIGMCLIGLLMIGEVVVLLLPASLFVFDSSLFDVSKEIVLLIRGLTAQSVSTTLELKPVILAFIPLTMFNIFFYVICMWQVKSILFSIKIDEPFRNKNAKSLFILCLAFIFNSFVLTNAESLFFDFAVHKLALVEVSLFSLSINWTMFFTGLLLFVLGGVFKYGNYLQDEFNETV